MNVDIFKILAEKIEKGGENSPFLLLNPNLELFHPQLESFIKSLLLKQEMDVLSLFVLADTGESIKIEEIKNFLGNAQIRSRFAFQVFIIENFSRATIQAQNSCLKMLEEPGEWNIFILTNQSESWILETILSRVQIFSTKKNLQNDSSQIQFFLHLIESYKEKQSMELLRYISKEKIEKQEAIFFLQALVEYIRKTGKLWHFLGKISDDIGAIEKYNANPRSIVDLYVLRI